MIEVRLFATFRENRGKKIQVDAKDGNEILEKIDIKKEDVAIFLINGRDDSLDTPLKDEDIVSLFPPVGGG